MAGLGGEASIELDASIEACWALAQDVESGPEWQDGLEAMNVRERDGQGRPLLAESVSDAKVRTIRSLVRFTYDAPRGVAWRQERGDLKAMDGEWALAELPGGGTRVTYRLTVDPGRMLGMLLRGPAEERLRQILVAGRPAEFERRLRRG
jgi:ribosome-associated toxin RatA of RatAB toxin-antitoxin module